MNPLDKLADSLRRLEDARFPKSPMTVPIRTLHKISAETKAEIAEDFKALREYINELEKQLENKCHADLQK